MTDIFGNWNLEALLEWATHSDAAIKRRRLIDE